MKTPTPLLTQSRCWLAGTTSLMLAAFTAQAQLDPAPRQILHLGVDSSLKGQGPMGAYAFYYWNMPDVPATNEVLRFAIAPVYIDGDLGFKGLLSEHTDLAVGAFGGLYANSYQEVDAGDWKKDQSFDAANIGTRVSIYHRLNPNDRIPLTLVARESVNYISFERSGDTSDSFALPQNQPVLTTRLGFRWGGIEPVLGPALAMELSGWYEMANRMESGSYGYGDDRRLEAVTHRIFGRVEIHYTALDSKNHVVAVLMGGTELNPDRMGSYRLGGMLPFTKEFPMVIPGYYYQELSAQDFGLAYSAYTIPFGSEKRWCIVTEAAAAVVKYIDGTGQPGAFNSGVGAGFGYSAPSRRWKLYSLFGYGFEAEREHGRGGYSLGAAFQYNFGATKMASDIAYEHLQEAHGDVGVTR